MDQNITQIYYNMINDHEQQQLDGLLNIFNNKSKRKYTDQSDLKGKRRIFSQAMLEKYDLPARAIIKEKLGDFVIDNPDEFQQDMIITDKNCKYKYLEIQVISQWKTDKYPYPTLYMYERKAKYGNDTLFLTLNTKFDKGFLFDRKSIEGKAPRRLVKYHREFVYDVPWNMVMTIDIETLTPDIINIY